MENISIDINLDVEVSASAVIAHLRFSNKSSNVQHLDKLTICYNNKIKNNFFEVLDKKRNRIAYKGVMMKRDVNPEDFIAINPSEKIETSIVLDEVYKISKGHKYYIQYSVFHPTYMDDSGFTKLQSNTVEITY